MSIVSEFREFIARGNVIDLAVGVIIGAAFGEITSSLVDNVVMPPIGLLLSGVDFAQLMVILKPDDPATKADELVAIKYGLLFNAIIKFLIIAWVVFLLVKAVNRIKDRAVRKGEPVPSAPAGPTQEELLTDIRNLLAMGRSEVAPDQPSGPAGRL